MIRLATLQQALDAAKILPAHRTAEQQRLVDEHKNIQAVANEDFEARRQQGIHGPA